MPRKRFNLPKGLQNKPAGSENWYQVFYRKDRRPKIKWVRLGAHDLTGAKLERERLLRTYELGLFDPWATKEEVQSRPDPLLRDAFDDFLHAHRGLAPSTLASRRSCFRLFAERIDPHRRRRLSQITETDIERFIEQPGLAESSRTKRLAELSTFFRWCAEEALVEGNVAKSYKRKRSRGQSVHTRQARRGAPRAPFMPDDLRRLLAEIQTTGRHLYLYDVVLFCVATGLRRGEVCHLRRMDVHLDAPPPSHPYPVTGRVRVRSWRDPASGKEFKTKTGKDRTVPLCPLAARIAARRFASVTTEDDSRPLFTALKGGGIGRSQLSELFVHYRRAVGLSDRYTFHSLRHSFASYLMMLGVNLFSIKRLLGHSSLNELDTYAELCEEYLLGDARALQRDMLAILCPGLPAGVIDRVLPSRRSLIAALSDDRFAAVQSLRSIIPMEEMLFAGIGYGAAAAARPTSGDGISGDALDDLFLETF